MALAMEEPWIERLNDRVEEWTTGLALSLVSRGCGRPLVGGGSWHPGFHAYLPEMWRERFKPRYKRMIERIKAANPRITVISTPTVAVAPLIDDFIELGVDVYNPVQPNVPGSEPQELMDKYGGKIAFLGA